LAKRGNPVFTSANNPLATRVCYTYVDQARSGDHICYYSDLSKMQAHYPKVETDPWSATNIRGNCRCLAPTNGKVNSRMRILIPSVCGFGRLPGLWISGWPAGWWNRL
jgi:hypothetical protein